MSFTVIYTVVEQNKELYCRVYDDRSQAAIPRLGDLLVEPMGHDMFAYYLVKQVTWLLPELNAIEVYLSSADPAVVRYRSGL